MYLNGIGPLVHFKGQSSFWARIIPATNIQSQVRLFADATAVYLTVTNMQDSQVLQFDLESLQHWERTWDMEFNPGKCQVIHITHSKSPVKYRYFMHNQELESVDAAKYLSKDLSWNTHINNITSTASKTLGFVKRNVVTKNKDIKTMAYNSLVRPQVEYASPVWSPYTKENINKIKKIQRRAARWVSNDFSYSSVTDMLSNLRWRSLENRCTDTRLAMFYKITYGLLAIPRPSYFEHPEVYTRHMHTLSYRQIHTYVCYYKYSFFPFSIVLWNKLPADLILVHDLDSFKTGVSKINHNTLKCVLLLIDR